MPKILLFDSYDSFTYNLKDYLEQNGAEVLVIRNDARTTKEIIALNVDGLVISPGPKKPEESGNLMDVLSYFHNKIPILGVCLGHQAIGVFFGFDLVKAPKPMHGKISEIETSSDILFSDIPKTFEVCRYHSLVLKPMQSDEIEVIATASDGAIMGIKHGKWPIWGVQYHPEAILSQFGHALLANWLKVVTLRSL